MKKLCLCSAVVLLLSVLLTGCFGDRVQAPGAGDPPVSESNEIPTLEELIEINDLGNIVKDHTNVYVRVDAKYAEPEHNYTEEALYLNGDGTVDYHKRSKRAGEEVYDYTSKIGNSFYYFYEGYYASMLDVDDSGYVDYLLEFSSTAIGKGYIENDQIVYHSYIIYEADELYDALRYDYTLRFNKDTKLIEQLDFIIYDANHVIDCEQSVTVSYDVADAESKFDTTAYEIFMASDHLIDLKVIVYNGTPEEVTYLFTTVTDSQVLASIDRLTYLLYTDPECQNMIETLEQFEGVKDLTVYAKCMTEPG